MRRCLILLILMLVGTVLAMACTWGVVIARDGARGCGLRQLEDLCTVPSILATKCTRNSEGIFLSGTSFMV